MLNQGIFPSADCQVWVLLVVVVVVVVVVWFFVVSFLSFFLLCMYGVFLCVCFCFVCLFFVVLLLLFFGGPFGCLYLSCCVLNTHTAMMCSTAGH